MPAAPEIIAPAHLWVPDHSSTAGGEAADLGESAGLFLDSEQRIALDAILAERPDGRWAALEAAVVAPRQNIKTFLFRVVVLADLYLFGSELVVWTAHEFNTAMEAFRDTLEVIEAFDHLSRRVRKVNQANGEEGIEFTSGQRLRFKARTKTGGRGLTGDRVILDEAFGLQPSHMGSLLPTMSARSVAGNPQILYGSSAGLVGSAVLRDIRDRGRKGGDPSLAYIEWCAADGKCLAEPCDHRYGVEGCILDDRERWAQANLAMGRRISVDFIAAERRSLTPEEFARERLGWWDEPASGVGGIPMVQWASCADREAALDAEVVLALDVAPGHVAGAVVACGGPLHVVEHGRGSSWIPAKLADLVANHRVGTVALDPSGPAGALIPDLEKPVVEGGAGLSIRSASNPHGQLVLLTGQESVRACEAFLSAVMEGRLVHRDQGALNTAAEGAGRRQVGDSWKWSRRDSLVDISPLVAATVAWWMSLANAEISIYEEHGVRVLG